LPNSEAHYCGPLCVTVDAQSRILYDKVLESLLLYDRRWPAHDHMVEIRIAAKPDLATEPAAGTFLRCARITVDVAESGLRATTICGAGSRLWQTGTLDRWEIDVPAQLIVSANLEDVEELVILALTTGWRSAGWVPVHAAAVTDGERCAIICAPSGGGKSTLTAAFVRRGWRAVGDDKLLLRVVDGRPQLSALQRTFNLHPATSAWFPEVGDLERLPRYSTWTAKRKVRIDSIWPEPAADSGYPTHLLRVRRAPDPGPIAYAPLGPGDTLTTLLRQVAIPADRSSANLVLSAVAPTARRVCGFDVVVGDDAYGRADALDALIGALQ
jgi:hypothetical protein